MTFENGCTLVVAPPQSVFGIATQSCCIRCPGDGDDPADIPLPPCESDDPPEYCDEAGSCFDKDLSGDTPEATLDEEIIRGLEEAGALEDLWELSNPNDNDQSNRQERGGWIVRSDDGSYDVVAFDEVASDP